MSFKVLLVIASSGEADALKRIDSMLPAHQRENLEIEFLVTGIGSVATAWAMKQWINFNGKPDLAVNAGIAGSYNDEFNTGEVVMTFSDCFADAGIEDGDKFVTLFEAGLMEANEFPYKEGLIYADRKYAERVSHILKPVKAITVNTSTGSEISRIKLLKKFNPDIETMEGATFFYICSQERIPFLAIRAISNMVETRNRNNWNISLALTNLSEKLIDVLLTVVKI